LCSFRWPEVWKRDKSYAVRIAALVYWSPIEHNGTVATLEDWFDPARFRNEYAPTGFKGYGVKTL
jgi:hypothetical protein